MKYSVIYSSQTGNTKLLAETIRKNLPEEDCVYFGAPDEKALEADFLYVGFWTDKGRCDARTLAFIKEIRNKNVFLYGTAGFGEDSSYFDRILDNVKKELDESVVVTGTYMCQGKMPMPVRERYIKMKEAPNPIPNLDGMIENFDKALSHPDEEDLKNLEKEIRSI